MLEMAFPSLCISKFSGGACREAHSFGTQDSTAIYFTFPATYCKTYWKHSYIYWIFIFYDYLCMTCSSQHVLEWKGKLLLNHLLEWQQGVPQLFNCDFLEDQRAFNGKNDQNQCNIISGKWRNNFLDYFARNQEQQIHRQFDDSGSNNVMRWSSTQAASTEHRRTFEYWSLSQSVKPLPLRCSFHFLTLKPDFVELSKLLCEIFWFLVWKVKTINRGQLVLGLGLG